jgi:prefoldin subunit 5
VKKQIIDVELELVEDQLGTVPKNRDVYAICRKTIKNVEKQEKPIKLRN